MSARFIALPVLRSTCDQLWTLAMLAGCACAVIALVFAILDMTWIAATFGVLCSACAGVAIGAALVERRFR